MNRNSNHIEKNPILKWTDRLESYTLCLLLTTLILLSCFQIFLRTFWGGGLLWADPVLRFLVIWCGFLGGVTATSQGKHIAIDLATDRLPEGYRIWLDVLTNIFCIVASAGLTWAASKFWWGEYQYPTTAPLGLPSWSWNSIYPLAFALITVKFSFLLVLELKTALHSAVSPGTESR